MHQLADESPMHTQCYIIKWPVRRVKGVSFLELCRTASPMHPFSLPNSAQPNALMSPRLKRLHVLPGSG